MSRETVTSPRWCKMVALMRISHKINYSLCFRSWYSRKGHAPTGQVLSYSRLVSTQFSQVYSLPKQPAITWVISCDVVCLDSCMIIYTWRWTSAEQSDRISFTVLVGAFVFGSSILFRGRMQKSCTRSFLPPVFACVCAAPLFPGCSV